MQHKSQSLGSKTDNEPIPTLVGKHFATNPEAGTNFCQWNDRVGITLTGGPMQHKRKTGDCLMIKSIHRHCRSGMLQSPNPFAAACRRCCCALPVAGAGERGLAWHRGGVGIQPRWSDDRPSRLERGDGHRGGLAYTVALKNDRVHPADVQRRTVEVSARTCFTSSRGGSARR